MGKPQSNFQYRTIFGVPLIAGNENVYEPVKKKRIKRRNDEKSTKKENKRL